MNSPFNLMTIINGMNVNKEIWINIFVTVTSPLWALKLKVALNEPCWRSS